MKSPGHTNVSHREATLKAGAVPPGVKKQGRRKGCEKPPGSGAKKGGARPGAGTPGKPGVIFTNVGQREAFIQEKMWEVFGTLTEDQLEAITPLEVMRLCTIGAVKAGQFGLALMAAEKWAPYMHAKLAPRLVDDNDDRTVRIEGGLPQLASPRRGQDD